MPLSPAKQRNASLRQVRDNSASSRDIGGALPPKDQSRRDSCERDFGRFCLTYFPHVFSLEWSEDHRKVIRQIEDAVLHGGLFATAMPRGSGKTSLAEVACIWAEIYGHRDFVTLIGSDEGSSLRMLDSIKTELESNDLLFDDFNEVCHPIRALEGISHRCKGQTSNNERTHIGWAADEIVLPTMPGSKASGAIIKVAGITGGVRGMKFKKPSGETIRPSLVVIDDPQTDQSARSASQCETRERILAGAILGLAGPGKKIAGIMPCTVIRRDDMADRILNRTLHPEWNGTRTKLVYSFPSNEKLWEQYAEIRAESLRAGNGGREATEFYAEHRAEMDAGAVVAWPARYDEDELSAVQNAMNLKLRDERAFFSEYQNEPQADAEARTDDLTVDQVSSKINRLPRRLVPLAASRVTGFIDVQGSLLYWLVAAWEDDFTGSVIDYGTFPDQPVSYFQLRDATRTFQTEFPNAGPEGQIFAGLEALTDELCSREWRRDDGATMRLERLLVDQGYSTDTIYQFCRQSKHAGVVMPSKGLGIGAKSEPMREYKKKPGDRTGLNWRIPAVKGGRTVRTCLHDTNYWKSFIHARLCVAMGDRGCLSLFGEKPYQHRLFAEHICSEYRTRTMGRGRELDEWVERPGRPDNHWLDCLSGAAVAASIQGAVLPEAQADHPVKAKANRVSFAELQRQQQMKG